MEQVEEMDRDEANYKCTICANAYNSRRDGGGLAFEDLPESWKCSVCDQPKACTKYVDPAEVGGLDEGSGRDENFEDEDSWAECQEQDADDWQEKPEAKDAVPTYDATVGHEEFAPRSGGDEDPRRGEDTARGSLMIPEASMASSEDPPGSEADHAC